MRRIHIVWALLFAAAVHIASEGPDGDRYCHDAGCGDCFWGSCTLF